MPGQRRKFPKKRRINRKRRMIHKKNKRLFISKDIVSYVMGGMRPFPPRYRCRLACEVMGSIAAGTTSATYQVGMNYLFTPFSGGAWTNVVTSSITTLQPTGFSNLCSATSPYNQYRVYASTITMTFRPTNQSDSIAVVVLPLQHGQLPSSMVQSLTLEYAKQKIVSANQQGGPITNSITVHKLVGSNKQAIANDMSGNFEAIYNAIPTVQLEWVVLWETPNAAVTTAVIDYTAKVDYYAEFWLSNPKQLSQL